MNSLLFSATVPTNDRHRALYWASWIQLWLSDVLMEVIMKFTAVWQVTFFRLINNYERYESCRTLCYDFHYTFLDVSKDRSVFIIWAKQSKNIYQMTRRHDPEHLNLQQHHSENVIFCTYVIFGKNFSLSSKDIMGSAGPPTLPYTSTGTYGFTPRRTVIYRLISLYT